MLLRFSVKNYKSFSAEVVLDLTASTITEHKDSVININNIGILPIAAIFGANGSGKSNLLEAIITMFNEVVGYQNNEDGLMITPYFFEDKFRYSPSEFEISIYSKKYNKEFRYGFSKMSNEILEEWLFSKTFSKTPTVKEKCVFYREKNNKLQTELKNNDEIDEINFISSVTRENELIITNIGKRNKCKYSFIYNWFNDQLLAVNFSNVNEMNKYKDQNLLKLLYVDKKWLQLIEDTIKMIDPAILGLSVQKELDSNMNDYFTIYSKHKRDNDDFVYVPFSTESCGTKKMLFLSFGLLLSLKEGRTCIIDELDSKLHPLLLRYIIRMFGDKDINIGGGQLIFTSHNLICLDSSDLRRDEIWFVEKNGQKSTIFSLYDFKEETIRKDLDFGKHYLNGRFGATPFINEV